MNWTYDHYQYLERELSKRADDQRQAQALHDVNRYTMLGKRKTRKGRV